MPWDPEINVFDSREAAENLLGFIAFNQRDALDWAAGVDVLPDILNFYNSARVVTSFPSLTILQESNSETSDDILNIRYSIVLEFALQSGDQDQITKDSKKYEMAIKSMIKNVPETTLFQNSIIEIVGEIGGVETEFDVLQSRQKQFIQIFQTKAEWRLRSSAY